MNINENHFFFRSNNHQLYGMLYEPVEENKNSEAFIILHPFAEEKKSSQKVLVDIARSLSYKGNSVMLFDFYGCGDSEGNLSDASLTQWLEDILSASSFLKEKTNKKNINLIGLRLGAYLGMIYTANNDDANKLVLIEPVINPVKDLSRLLRSKLMKELCTDGEVSSNRDDLLTKLDNDISIDFSGHEISSKFYKDLLKYEDANPYELLSKHKNDVLLINISQMGKPTRQFQKLLLEIGDNKAIQKKVIKLEPFWGQIDLPDCRELIDYIAQWYCSTGNQYPVIGNWSQSLTPDTDHMLLNTITNTSIREKAISIKNDDDKIFGILSEPDSLKSKGVIIVFLHGWAGYRIGPHRIFVDFARRLSHLGFHCVRFDFRGKGYGCLNNTATNKTMLADLECLLDHIYKENLPKKIILIGICSGARLALYYAMKGLKPIEYIIELSTTVLRPDDNLKVEVSRSRSTIQEYLVKLNKRETWNKLIKGDVRLKLISKIISEPIINSFKVLFRKKNSGNKSKNENSRIYKDAFLNFNGEILAIHGEKDPETEVALKQVNNLTAKYFIPFEKHIVKGANHSFYSIKWKNEIFDIIQQWLNEKYPILVKSKQ